MMKILLLLVVLAVLWLIFSPENGFFSLVKQQRQLKILQQETQVLLEKNEKMSREIKRLKGDSAYLEEMARKEYGLLKDNETVFDFSPEKTKEKKE